MLSFSFFIGVEFGGLRPFRVAFARRIWSIVHVVRVRFSHYQVSGVDMGISVHGPPLHDRPRCPFISLLCFFPAKDITLGRPVVVNCQRCALRVWFHSKQVYLCFEDGRASTLRGNIYQDTPTCVVSTSRRGSLHEFPFRGHVRTVVRSRTSVPTSPSILSVLVAGRLNPLHSIHSAISRGGGVLQNSKWLFGRDDPLVVGH